MTGNLEGCWGLPLGLLAWLQGDLACQGLGTDPAEATSVLRPRGGGSEAVPPGVAAAGQQRASVPRVTPSCPQAASSSMRTPVLQLVPSPDPAVDRGRVLRLPGGAAAPRAGRGRASGQFARPPRGWHTAAPRPWPLSLFSKKGEEFVGSGGGVIYRGRRKSPKSQGLTQRRRLRPGTGPPSARAGGPRDEGCTCGIQGGCPEEGTAEPARGCAGPRGPPGGHGTGLGTGGPAQQPAVYSRPGVQVAALTHGPSPGHGSKIYFANPGPEQRSFSGKAKYCQAR